eukprot:g445.t1
MSRVNIENGGGSGSNGISRSRMLFLDSLLSDCSVRELSYLNAKTSQILYERTMAETSPTKQTENRTIRGEISRSSGPLPSAKATSTPGIPTLNRAVSPFDTTPTASSPLKGIASLRVAEDAEAVTEAVTSPSEGQHFYAIQGLNEICEIDGKRRQMKVIGKTDFQLASLARQFTSGELYATERANLLKIDSEYAKVTKVGLITCGGYPARNVRGLCFDRVNRVGAYCLALKGSIRSIRSGDTICSLDVRTGTLNPEVVVELSDIVALVHVREGTWYVWSSYKGLLEVTKSSLVQLSDAPIGISIRSLDINSKGELFGIGDRLYQIHVTKNEGAGCYIRFAGIYACAW